MTKGTEVQFKIRIAIFVYEIITVPVCIYSYFVKNSFVILPDHHEKSCDVWRDDNEKKKYCSCSLSFPLRCVTPTAKLRKKKFKNSDRPNTLFAMVGQSGQYHNFIRHFRAQKKYI